MVRLQLQVWLIIYLKDYDKTNVLIGDGTGYATKGAKYFMS